MIYTIKVTSRYKNEHYDTFVVKTLIAKVMASNLETAQQFIVDVYFSNKFSDLSYLFCTHEFEVLKAEEIPPREIFIEAI